ncbi:MAG TPA: hypothetical protein DCS01_00810 [Idiomarina abyssalis]|jgi:hypothetical protein|uniref:hypothetical protein n=1 Tax=Idiomarina TaxID=135575 RepID=UPI000C5B269F|nr:MULTISPECIES: hypothetical protein [Idiomarina]MAB22066.1 hypothetical protein [Idiomarina sp.]MBH93305.1 hypothetical protein [Idiomarina sp.]HAS13820.1 hypothetical protein [Idiomarina abyssalis]|tara:strand:+ start:21366 stop:22436 length:1071 start_codon:yes stop_codon:yes gene_type:complete
MQPVNDISPKESSELTVRLIQALNDAIDSGTDEPSIVANIAKNIPAYLTKSSRLGAFNFSSGSIANVPGSIFVHQTPKVSYTGIGKTKSGQPKSIEVGDLLLLSTIQSNTGEVSRRAMLFQAKMFESIPVSSTGNSEQHKLYNEWPIFHYLRSTRDLNGMYRWICDLDLHESAKYLLLKDTVSPLGGWPHWLHSRLPDANALTANPTDPLSHYSCFVHEVYNFILGNVGKEFKVLNTTEYKDLSTQHSDIVKNFHASGIIQPICPWQEGWSLLINDLLRITSQKRTRLMGSTTIKGARGVNTSSYKGEESNKVMSILNKFGFFSEPPSTPEADDEEPSIGLNIIEFTLISNERFRD